MPYIENAIKYPNITDLVNAGGGLNIEYSREMGVVAIAFDEGRRDGLGREKTLRLDRSALGRCGTGRRKVD